MNKLQMVSTNATRLNIVMQQSRHDLPIRLPQQAHLQAKWTTTVFVGSGRVCRRGQPKKVTPKSLFLLRGSVVQQSHMQGGSFARNNSVASLVISPTLMSLVKNLSFDLS